MESFPPEYATTHGRLSDLYESAKALRVWEDRVCSESIGEKECVVVAIGWLGRRRVQDREWGGMRIRFRDGNSQSKALWERR